MKELIINGIVLLISGWLAEQFLNIKKKTNTMDDCSKSYQFSGLIHLNIRIRKALSLNNAQVKDLYFLVFKKGQE